MSTEMLPSSTAYRSVTPALELIAVKMEPTSLLVAKLSAYERFVSGPVVPSACVYPFTHIDFVDANFAVAKTVSQHRSDTKASQDASEPISPHAGAHIHPAVRSTHPCARLPDPYAKTQCCSPHTLARAHAFANREKATRR